MEEKVDILLATYNSNIEYLKKQIESILNQTHSEFELIISDDCSTNKEVKDILDEYAKKDNRVKLYFQEKNIGYTKNFGFLLEKSKANYIAFSDHDDIWDTNKIEICLKKLKNEKVDMIYCNCRQIDENDKVIQNNYFKYKNVPQVHGKNKIAISRCVGIGCSQMITKKVKDKMLPLKEKVMAHDWLCAFIANELNGITYIKEPLFSYRLHNANVFGGRSLSQNIKRWKKDNGRGYKSYLLYREDAIRKAYLDGIEMCKEYVKEEKNRKFIDKAEKYYESILKSKIINLHIIKYFDILYEKKQGKKMIREIVLFHLPVVGYLRFRENK